MKFIADQDAYRYISAVREFADNVLRHGRDTYGPKHTPLFVDGLNIDTLEPPVWKTEGEEWILSNLASQQNLFRTLDGLTSLTGERKYREEAISAIRYAFDNLRSPNGLLYWGGHQAYDAGKDIPAAVYKDAQTHELKEHFPYYSLMWEADPRATKRFIEAFWQAHITNWDNLDMNRHGSYGAKTDAGWPENYVGGEVFFIARHGGLSFGNTGSDLFYAAAMLHKFTGDGMPLLWAERLAGRYQETRNPNTGLGGYQYSRLDKIEHGIQDRAEAQFGDNENLKGHLVLEGTILNPANGRGRFGMFGIVQLKLGEMLGGAGSKFRRWALEDLRAYWTHAYNPADNTFVALLTDGTKLSPKDVRKDGYYGKVGGESRNPHGLHDNRLNPQKADSLFLWAYCLASGISGDPFMWEAARVLGKGNGLGDIGETSESRAALNLNTDSSDPLSLVACLELYRQTCGEDFLRLAKTIGDNIMSQRFHKGFFAPSAKHLYARVDSIEALALLHLAAAIRGEPDVVPDMWPGQGYFSGRFDGIAPGRTTDDAAIYSRLRGNT